MKTIIAGSRWIFKYPIVEKAVLLSGWKDSITEIVSGGAKGVDKLGEKYARINGINTFIFPALWEKDGKAAGILRNVRMAEYADCLIAVWDGTSRGTEHMIQTMKRKNKPTFIYTYNGNQTI